MSDGPLSILIGASIEGIVVVVVLWRVAVDVTRCRVVVVVEFSLWSNQESRRVWMIHQRANGGFEQKKK